MSDVRGANEEADVSTDQPDPADGTGLSGTVDAEPAEAPEPPEPPEAAKAAEPPEPPEPPEAAESETSKPKKPKSKSGKKGKSGKSGKSEKSGKPKKSKAAKASESADPPTALPTDARRGTTLAVVAAITAVVMLAATIVFAVLYVRSRSKADELADTRTTVLRAAQKTAIDFSSYDYRHLDRDFAGVASQLTPTFRKSYRSTAGALKATLSQYRAVGTAKVLDAGVAQLSANRATVVVFLDQTVTSKTSTTPTVDRNRIRVQLQRSGDRWLVAKLDVR